MNEIQVGYVEQAIKVLDEIKLTKDFDLGFAVIKGLHEKGVQLDGAIGVLVDGMEKMWIPSEHEGERFLDATIRLTPLHPRTVRRHLDIKTFFETAEIPEHVLPTIEKADQKSLIRIAKAADMHDLSVESWEKIAEASYSGEKSVSAVIRKITKTEPRSNWLAISIDERGILVAHGKEDNEIVHVEIGHLKIRNERTIVKKAIKRITSCAGISDKVEY